MQDESRTSPRTCHEPPGDPHSGYSREYQCPQLCSDQHPGGIPSYNEEQVALVIEDISGLGMRVPVILGMPTIHRLCRQMKESEIESAPDEWKHALCSYEASQGIFLQAMTPGTDNKDGTTSTLPTQGRTLWIWTNQSS